MIEGIILRSQNYNIKIFTIFTNYHKVVRFITTNSLYIINFKDKFIFSYITHDDEIITEKTEYLTSLKNLKLTKPKFQYDVNIVGNFYEIKLISENLIKNYCAMGDYTIKLLDKYKDDIKLYNQGMKHLKKQSLF